MSKGDVPLEIHSNSASFLLYLNQDNVGANDENSYGLYIDSESQFDPPIYTNMSGGKSITQLGHYSSNIGTNWFFRDVSASVSNVPVVFIEQDNAADDQAALNIQQDGTGDIITSGTKFIVKSGGAVLSNDTFYFKYASSGGSPLCHSSSGSYPGYYFIRPCGPIVTVSASELCLGATYIDEADLQAILKP